MHQRFPVAQRAGLAALWLALPASPALANPQAEHDAGRIASFAVGIFCMDGVGVAPSTAPGTIKGTVNRMDRSPTLAIETQAVPAIDQLMFGVQAREAVENGTVTITVNYPPLGKDGTTAKSWETEMETGSSNVHAYYLGLSDGDPVGRWSIVGMANDTLLFYAEFDVVPLSEGIEDPCIYKPVG